MGLELLFLDSYLPEIYSLEFVLTGCFTLSKSVTVLNCKQSAPQQVVALASMKRMQSWEIVDYHSTQKLMG